MDEAKIENYVIKNGLLPDAKITKIGFGESNINYLAEHGGKKLVVRTARTDVPNEPRFENEHHYMKFVEHLGIDFAPRSLFYDRANHVHVVSYVGGRDASAIDLDRKQIQVFFEQLAVVENVKYADYLQWCEAEKITPKKPISFEEDWKIYFRGRLDYISKSVRDDFSERAYRWILERIGFVEGKRPRSKPKTRFVHGDLRWNVGGGNLRVSGSKVVFVDWELAGFKYGYALDFADILGTIPNNKSTEKAKRELIGGYEKISKGSNNQLIEYGLLSENIGTVIWATERYCFLENTKQNGKDRYKERAESLMGESDIFYSRPFKDWF